MQETEPLTFACTQCGARLHLDGSTRTLTCAYCGGETLLPDAVWHRFHPEEARVATTPAAPSTRRVPLLVALVLMPIPLIVIVLAFRGTSSPVDPHATPGDRCRGRVAACSRDGKAQLACGADQKLSVVQNCKGPNGCRAASDGKSLSCDMTYADPKDPCDVADDDACSTDHRAELRCQGGRFAVISTCKGPDGCTLTPSPKGVGYTLSCDDHVADVGDPCFDAERVACSSNKRFLLSCTAQRFAIDRTCRTSCSARKVAGTSGVKLECK